MLGSILSGHEESGGELVIEDGVQTHMINVPNNYTFDDLEAIVET